MVSTPIDLNAQDPGIRRQDFLQMKEDENACRWDVLSLSLVLNFVPDPRERGAGILLPGISFMPHIFREDAAVGSFVSRRFPQAFGSPVRDSQYRSGLLSARELIAHPLVQLPLPCVQNSRYLTLSRFEGLMEHVGFEKIKERWRAGGRMGYWLFRKVNPTGLEKSTYERKSVLRSGKTRNNFTILL